jgi:hypothetical protein
VSERTATTMTGPSVTGPSRGVSLRGPQASRRSRLARLVPLAVLALALAVVAPMPAGAASHDAPDGASTRVDLAVTPTGAGAWVLSADGGS